MKLLPKARGGLLASDHSKRGRRFVTLLDPETQQVTLLDAWEHAMLLLCDGTRDVEAIVELLSPSVDGVVVDKDTAERGLKFFERQSLIESVGLRKSQLAPPGPKTIAALQQAWKEWRTVSPPTAQFPRPEAFPPTGITRPPPGLGPTVALPDDDREPPSVPVGATLTLAAADEALEEPPHALLDVLGAVDDVLGEAEAIEKKSRERPARPKKATAELVVVEARPPDSGVHAKLMSKVEVALEPSSARRGDAVPVVMQPPARHPPVRPRPEAQLSPTMVRPVPQPPVPQAPVNDPPTQPGAMAPKPATSDAPTQAAEPPKRSDPPRRRAFSDLEPTVEMVRTKSPSKDPSGPSSEPHG
ncbi:MAG: hypothetical protein HY791_16540 [Deltaproteobacteria bacterium]|nr:hypothetical protein [Deltaproteobacteria bacterium]